MKILLIHPDPSDVATGGSDPADIQVVTLLTDDSSSSLYTRYLAANTRNTFYGWLLSEYYARQPFPAEVEDFYPGWRFVKEDGNA